MEVYVYEGKNEELVLDKALTNLNVKEEDILIKKEKIKGGLFKGDTFKFTVIKIDDVQSSIKEFLAELLKLMDLDVKFECKKRNDSCKNRNRNIFSK